jgi:hypothetical protein
VDLAARPLGGADGGFARLSAGANIAIARSRSQL